MFKTDHFQDDIKILSLALYLNEETVHLSRTGSN